MSALPKEAGTKTDGTAEKAAAENSAGRFLAMIETSVEHAQARSHGGGGKRVVRGIGEKRSERLIMKKLMLSGACSFARRMQELSAIPGARFRPLHQIHGTAFRADSATP